MFKWENISKLWGLWKNEQGKEKLLSDADEELLTNDNNILPNELSELDSQSVEAEIEAQIWLELVYSASEDKFNCQVLNLGTKNEWNTNGLEVKLTGSLDLTGFSNLKKFWCDGQKITKLNLKNCSRLEELQCWENELMELDLSNCLQLKKLGCGDNKLTNLYLTNCEKLEELDFRENQLTQLDLRQNKQLVELWCQQNQLSQIIFPPQLTNLEKIICYENFLTDLDWVALPEEKLTVLSLGDNNFPPQDLSCFARFANLKEFGLGNSNQLSQIKISQGIYNRWTGSLQPLQNMKQLHTLHIDNTDLDRGTEYLPASVMEIHCSYYSIPNSKVKLIVKELEKNNVFILSNFVNKIYLKKKLSLEILNQIKNFDQQSLTPEQEKLLAELIPAVMWRYYYKRYGGLCTSCQQLNGYNEWCQPCVAPHLQVNFDNWTSGNEEIDKLIQKCQLEARDLTNMLEWIPYQQFTDVEYLAEGGFSKIYRAKWSSGPIKGWNTKDNKLEKWGNENVVLKILTNSQNISVGFLQEIINYKLVARDEHSFIVKFYGLSQNPETGNYVIVMSYMREGNLREFLQSNYKKLNFQGRFFQLLNITQGLWSIHEADLVHQDLHAGNVLNWLLYYNNRVNSYITDLGLSRPTQETNKDKIYGVLPYVAPEVLREKNYTQSSDIYSFGMIAYELFSNQPPLAEYAYDDCLALRICEGLRPNIEEMIAPQLLKDLISRCWDADPEQRPTASELLSILGFWLAQDFSIRKHTEFYHQYQELTDNDAFSTLTNNPPHNYSTDKYTSRRLDFPNLPQPQNSKELNERFWNSSEYVRTVEFSIIGFNSNHFNNKETKSEEENNQERLIKETKRQLSNSSHAENSQGKTKFTKLISGLEKFYFEPDEREEISIDQWKNIHPNFTPHLINSWINHGFTPKQCQDWININSPTEQDLAIQEPEYYVWLRDGKQVNSDWVLNQGNSEQLKQEFHQWEQEQLQTQIQILPKNNLK